MAVLRWPYLPRTTDEELVVAQVRDRRCVALAGPAGIGKTAMATAVVARLGADGATVHRITASPAAAPIPLGCIAPLVGGVTAGDVVGIAAATLDDGGRPSVLVVDDAHHLDDPSAVVVHQLAISRAVHVLLTIRPDERCPAAVTRLLADAGTVWVPVGPLAPAEITQLACDALEGPLDGASSGRLVRSAGGNPLYARELIEGSLATGALRRSGDVWRFVAAPSATPLLEELVLARLRPLDDGEREAVELLALAGRLELDLARAVIDDAVLELLERSGILVIDVGGRTEVDVVHPLYRDISRNRLGLMARTRLYRRLAEATADRPAPTPAAELRAAVWSVRGGVVDDPAQLERAARQAMVASDAELAAELAGAAFAARPSADAAFIAARSLSESGHHDRAEMVLRAALDGIPDISARAAIGLRLAEERWWWAHDLVGARAILRDARPGIEPWDTVLDAQAAVFDLLSGDVTTSLAAVEPLWPDPAEPVRFVGGIAYAQGLAYVDRAGEAFAVASECFERSAGNDPEFLGDPYVHVFGQVLALIHGGRLDEARGAAELVHQLAAEQTSLVAQAWGATMHGFAMLFSGRPAGAFGPFAEGLELWLASNCSGLARWAASGHALAGAATDRLDEAEASLLRADELDGRGFGLYDPFLALAHTWISTVRGDIPSARAHAEAATDAACASGALVHVGVVAHDLARLGHHDLARSAADRIPPLRSPSAYLTARLRYVEAAELDDGERLAAAGETFEGLGADVFAAEAFTLAAGAHRRRGARRDARRDEGRAGRALQRAGGARTPALAERRRGGVLSAREAEIATLVAAGASNREIAHRLVIGERTVESHVAHAFTKLGITRRHELASALAAVDP